MPKVCFEANHLSFNRGSHKILSDVSFKLYDGSFTTLIGPNGAGKSTLLQLMLGNLKPTSGTLSWTPLPRIGLMPQRMSIDTQFPLTVEHLLDLKPGSIDSHERTRIEHLTQTCELHHQQLYQLSGGELQRVLLAYALLGDPDVLLLDEPMQGLDVDAEFIFLDILKTLKDDYKKTILMVSHDLHLVFKHSDHVICLQNHICCQGAPETVQEDPAYHMLFGQRQHNLITTYAHRHDHVHGTECNHE